MVFHVVLFVDIITLFLMLSFHLMVNLLYLVHGMLHFVFGISTMVYAHVDLLDILKMFYVAFSADNRQIVSASRDRSIKLWNTLGECKYTIQEDGHSEWVSCVKFSPSATAPVIVSAGWDKLVKVWLLSNCKLRTNLVGHTGYLNTVTVSPDGSLCASGGKDGVAMLWDLTEGKRLYSLEAGDIIHSLVFSPNRYWLCAATTSSIKIWDLESKCMVDEIKGDFVPTGKNAQVPHCTCLAWSADGSDLFAGYTDNIIRVYHVNA